MVKVNPVIIMDISMPVMDGVEAAKALKSGPKTKDIPVIVLSASSTVEQKEKVMESGFFAAFLEKPVNAEQLFKELSNVIAHYRAADSASSRSHDQAPFNPLPEETLERLPQLIKILREDILPLLENFKGALKMNEVKTFADKVKQLGEEFDVKALIDYAHRLDEFEQDFDIEGIRKSLEDFPVIVQDLASQMEVY
ncbi:MAG: response regulator [bacterium]|nr:response regulator [bacterium]